MNQNQNQNQNDFKYLTIALNDHGGYENTPPKIFNNIPTFISECSSIEQKKVKTFLTSDDLFFVYSVPHDCKHMESKEEEETQNVFTFMPTKDAQKFASNTNVDTCKRTLKNLNIEEITKQQLIIFFKKYYSFLKQYFSLFEIKDKENSSIIENINKSANENKNKEIFEKNKNNIEILKKQLNNFFNITKNKNIPTQIKELSLTDLKSSLEDILNILNQINVDLINSPDNKEAFQKFKNILNNILRGTIPYYENIVNGKHNFYVREEFNDESNDYFLNPRIDLITTNIGTTNIGEKTNIGNNQTFIEVLNNVLQEKTEENKQPNSDCSIDILQNFVTKLESVKTENVMQYSTSQLLIVLYIIYEHYEGNCFITVNANHCRTCINGGKPRRKTRRKIRRNKKTKTKKRKANKKTKVNRKKTKRKTNKRRTRK